MYKVYGMSLSGNCHKIRMVLDHLAQPYEWIETDIGQGASRTPEFLSRNPVGKVPVLELPDGRYLSESNAIIQYLANGSPLWPSDRFEQADTLKWMFFEQNRHEPSVAEARYIKLFLPADSPRLKELPGKHKTGNEAFSVMEQRLLESDFLVTSRCNVADIALFAYTHVAEEGGFDMSGYPAIAGWIERILELPGFTRMVAQHGL
ncbi:MAG: glutathione S-transferase family protein [Gammaproteobacteria bacterium]|nr:glutathione S-transferase family protein [Gammaproteobacteria bacterium]